MVTVSICGCGNRGLTAYARFAAEHPDRMQVVAGADVKPERLQLLRELYGVSEENCFRSDRDLLAQPKLSDAMIIATQDKDHVRQAMAALEKGYHLILEKPVSRDLAECLDLLEKAEETDRYVMVCHELRYTPFYAKIRELLDTGAIGDVRTIDMTENVGYYHFAHSYVRGNWRKSDDSSPMILAKCCHDLDLARWFADAPCKRVQSFGSLSEFRSANAPFGAAAYCMDGCTHQADCPYDCEKVYITGAHGVLRNGEAWPMNTVVDHPTVESLEAALKEGPYGRCVYFCDNDVPDHQTVNMEFENGVTATFTVSAFSSSIYRGIKITGTEGELMGRLEKQTIVVRPFGEKDRVYDLHEEVDAGAGHGGGDNALTEAFVEILENGGTVETDLLSAIDSHVIALAAEYSRTHDGVTVDLKEFTDSEGAADKKPARKKGGRK